MIVRVFTYGLEEQGSIPGQVISKTQKMVHYIYISRKLYIYIYIPFPTGITVTPRNIYILNNAIWFLRF